MPTQMGCAAFEGNFPKRDSALVRALRDAGAVILGKTVTTELGGAHPGPTTNPFDALRTPGGSSSGSAAAIGAGMIPAAIGTQVGGSVIRPASYCGNWALKPTQGALNRGERQGYSQSTVGVHAGSPDRHVARRDRDRATRGRRPGTAGPLRPDGRAGSRQAAGARRDGDRRLEGCGRHHAGRFRARARGAARAGRRDPAPRRFAARRVVRARHRVDQGDQQRHLRVRESPRVRKHCRAVSRQAERPRDARAGARPQDERSTTSASDCASARKRGSG